MSSNASVRGLRVALFVTGAIFIFLIYPLGLVWPSGWCWGKGPSHYLPMIIAVYATLGAFLMIAAKNPFAHKSLIWFTVWSSAVHASIMLFQGLTDPLERGHLIGDVPALFAVAATLGLLMIAADLNAPTRSTGLLSVKSAG